MCPNNPNVARSSSFADSTRDGDPARYGGMGCLKAAANISGDLGKALIGMNPADQRAIDDKLLSMDTVREPPLCDVRDGILTPSLSVYQNPMRRAPARTRP